MLKRLHKVSFPNEKKATLFHVDFLWAFLLKPPCVLAIEDWPVCMGKCTSTVSLPNQIEFRCRVCVFPRSKKCSIPSLCNWRLGRGAEARRQGIRERWVCFSHISLFLFCWATLHNYLWTCFMSKGLVPPLFRLCHKIICSTDASLSLTVRHAHLSQDSRGIFTQCCVFGYRINGWLMDSCQTGCPPPKSDNFRISVIISNRRSYWFKP